MPKLSHSIGYNGHLSQMFMLEQIEKHGEPHLSIEGESLPLSLATI